MTDLVACLLTGKGTWTYVMQLMQKEPWEKVFLVTNAFGRDNFHPPRQAELILIEENQTLPDMTAEIVKQLKEKMSSTDLAVNLISGTGKEHMAVLGAAFKAGLSVRLVALDETGVIEV